MPVFEWLGLFWLDCPTFSIPGPANRLEAGCPIFFHVPSLIIDQPNDESMSRILVLRVPHRDVGGRRPYHPGHP